MASAGGSPAGGAGLGNGTGAGAGKLTDGGGVATGFDVGDRAGVRCAITTGAGTGGGASATAASVFALGSVRDAGMLRRP